MDTKPKITLIDLLQRHGEEEFGVKITKNSLVLLSEDEEIRITFESSLDQPLVTLTSRGKAVLTASSIHVEDHEEEYKIPVDGVLELEISGIEDQIKEQLEDHQ